MAKWKIYTPDGVQDILFEDCFVKKDLEGKFRDVFVNSGFFEVETPTLEFYDVFSAGGELTPQETMFKFYDQQGRILVLRPDMTIPVARIAATKFKDKTYPIRCSYIGNTFLYNELGGGKQKEFTQAGVEILGINSPEADAEVIATAITAIKEAGLENFQIDIGQVEFFKGLMKETGLSNDDIEQMRLLIDSKDFVGIEQLVKAHDIREDLKELIFSLPKLFGSVDVIDKVERIKINDDSIKALENLRKVIEILDDYGYSKYVSVDLGMVQRANYYTGIIFKGFTYGVGFPILSGGRYDKLVGRFAKDCPATGFSLGVNLIMQALDRQKIEKNKKGIDTIISYKDGGRKTAFTICKGLREQGLTVEIDINNFNKDDVVKYALSKEIGGIIFISDEENIQLYNLATGEITNTSVSKLIGG